MMKRMNLGKILGIGIFILTLAAMAVSCTQFFRLTDVEQLEENGGGHTHTWDAGEVTTSATCTTDGEKTCTCTVCGETKTEIISATGHTWGASFVTTAPTCTADGVMTYTCNVCGETKTEVISAGHAFEWASDETHHWHICTVCNVIDDTTKAVHTWDAGTITTEPTATLEGVMTYKCTVCDFAKTATIPADPADALLGDKVINGMSLGKTDEVAVITTATTVHMTDDSSWSGYVANSYGYYKGVFIKDRAVTLSPFAMGKYEVTQELYKAVLESDAECNATPSSFSSSPADSETQEKRPVEYVTWYDAVYFCNALTKLTMSEADCVYTITGITRDTSNKSITSAIVTQDFTKKGYRLPTEAEWEFAARGGDAAKPEWKYAFSGVNVAEGNMVHNGSTYLNADTNLNDYAWYASNSGSKTHEVGLKKANTLGLYDMSGNVWEWCWDWYSGTVSTDAATDPAGPGSGSNRLARGGSWDHDASGCAVSGRGSSSPYTRNIRLGLRLVRSL